MYLVLGCSPKPALAATGSLSQLALQLIHKSQVFVLLRSQLSWWSNCVIWLLKIFLNVCLWMCPQMEEIKVSPDYNWFRSTVPLKRVSTSWFLICDGGLWSRAHCSVSGQHMNTRHVESMWQKQASQRTTSTQGGNTTKAFVQHTRTHKEIIYNISQYLWLKKREKQISESRE